MIFFQYSLCYVCLSLLVSLMVDWFYGEPPIKIHPVVMMGRYLDWASKNWAPSIKEASNYEKRKYFFYGAFLWILGAAFFTYVAYLLSLLADSASQNNSSILIGIILSSLLSWKLLRSEVLLVSRALEGSVDLGRNQLSRLVSRDVSELTEVQVRESAIETLSENLNDSVIAPLFWFVIGGLPAVVLYRYANTADAMWGYRTFRGGFYWEWFGKTAAKVDDILSWLPAILTALFILIVSKTHHLRMLLKESKKTISPNGGWPMGAMAIAIGVKLTKPGVYELNPMGRAVHAGDIERACHLSSLIIILIAMFAAASIFFTRLI